MTTRQDRAEFKSFCQQASDDQLQAIYEKEDLAARNHHAEDRAIYAEIALSEGERRGLYIY